MVHLLERRYLAAVLNLRPGVTLVASAGYDMSFLTARITNAAADGRSTLLVQACSAGVR